jgi:hypothetical protein
MRRLLLVLCFWMALLFATVLLVVATAGMVRQETRLPPGHYCKNQPPAKNETRAHGCHCKYVCSIDQDGNV